MLYRIAPQCSSAPLYLVPKVVQQSSLAALDTRGAFILQTQEETVIWQVRQHMHCSNTVTLLWYPNWTGTDYRRSARRGQAARPGS